MKCNLKKHIMKNYDLMFEQEQKAIQVKQELAKNESAAKAEVIIDFCEKNLFDFLDYLQNKFSVKKHGVNYHFDKAVYDRKMVESYVDRQSAIYKIKNHEYFSCGINYKWSNGGHYDTIRVTCVDYKPVFKYQGEVMSIDEFEKLVIKQIQETINKNSQSFQILTK